jgi:hypothetical protein
MRKTVLAMTAAAAMLSVGALSAGAMTLTAPDGARAAIDTISPVEQAGCWRHGWHGWGWYRWCGHRYGYGYDYGYDRGPSWRWHRGHRWHHDWY